MIFQERILSIWEIILNNNMEFELKKCEACGQMVPEHTIDRYGECGACMAEERANNMCVDDMKDK
jgi:hypothetical protein